MFGFIILNYVNYNETVGAIKNLSSQTWFNDIKIYVVENGSGNESSEVLRDLKKHIKFELIISSKNLGFAKGSNLAVRKARKDGCIFIAELNSDARIMENQSHFLDVIKKIYSEKERVALITPDIKNLDNVPQNPMDRNEFSFMKKLLLKLFFYTYADKVYFFLRTRLLYNLVTTYVARRYQRRKSNFAYTTPESGYIYAALGSCQILTPLYFEYFDGHDEVNFLYCEEYIKAEHLKKAGLKTWYEDSIHVLHKESKSVEMITKSHKNKVKFLLSHMLKSGRIFVKMLDLKR
jgi:GT2 family glycosyltransferase